MTESLGRLLGAPLVYVLAEVRLPTILDTAKRAAAAQEALRSRFPRLVRLNEVQTVIGPSASLSASQSFAFSDVERNKGVVVTSGSLVYHVTAYKESQDFFQELEWVLKAVEPFYASDLVARAGLRYVDAIIPSPGEDAFRYVKSEFCGINLDSGQEKRRIQMLVEYPRQNGALTLRLLSLGPGFYLTPDLVPDLLTAPAWVRDAQNTGRSAVLLDTDRWENMDRPFSSDGLLATFRELKKDIRTAFLGATTDYAMKCWQEPRLSDEQKAIANG
jgi:uncharacterized protein (TIGR04255 family)